MQYKDYTKGVKRQRKKEQITTIEQEAAKFQEYRRTGKNRQSENKKIRNEGQEDNGLW